MDNDIADIQQEIDRTVWKVFQNAFESMDGAALNSVYADSVLRVTPDGIDTQNQFKQENETRFKTNIANKDKITLDFWFDRRQTTLSTSYDVGFYRMGLTSISGSTQYFYGQFHIVLEIINGQWKIVQDWGTESIGGHPITAEDFGRKLTLS
ncbi:MAG: hypothetical protein JJ921_19010 [Pseudomonadales bacterium]|nr:hypothetical protein [Pseudomonadales bacterium]MBO7007948.1 hypothetical protein [Pseudomonadales bacterium]